MKVTTTPGKKRPTTGKTTTTKKKSEIKTTQLTLKDVKEKPRSITPTREKIKITNELNKSLIQLCENGENLKNICAWCLIYSNPYTKHCYICNKCINYKEFHNNWINNCIGRRNIDLYFKFLGFLIIYIFIKVILCFICLLAISSNRKLFIIFHILINLTFIGLIIYYIYRTYCKYKNKKFIHYYEEYENEVNI